MRKKTVVWLVTGILSVIISVWFLLAAVGLVLFTLFLRSGFTIDGQQLGGVTKADIELIAIGFSYVLVPACMAIFSFYRYHKANVFNRTQALTSNRKV